VPFVDRVRAEGFATAEHQPALNARRRRLDDGPRYARDRAPGMLVRKMPISRPSRPGAGAIALLAFRPVTRPRRS